MNMRVKRILCLAVAVLLCFSLAGCKELDNARAHHAIMRDDGTILLNGDVYVPLPYSDDFNPPMDWSESITVTNPDVPVLLSDFFSLFYFNVSEEGVLKDTHIIGDSGTYYCLEKDAAELTARIEVGAQMDGMRYAYAHYDMQTDEWSEKTHYLTEEQINTVKRVVATVEPVVVDYPDGEYLVSLEWCSEDGLFTRDFGDLYRYNGRYALVNWNEESGECQLYEASAEYNTIFDAIVAPYEESEKSFYGSW